MLPFFIPLVIYNQQPELTTQLTVRAVSTLFSSVSGLFLFANYFIVRRAFLRNMPMPWRRSRNWCLIAAGGFWAAELVQAVRTPLILASPMFWLQSIALLVTLMFLLAARELRADTPIDAAPAAQSTAPGGDVAE